MFEAAGNDVALYTAYPALGRWRHSRADGRSLEAFERAARTRPAGGPAALAVGVAPHLRVFGTTPASEVLAWLDENEPRAGRRPLLRAYRAGALAMLGRFDEARAILAETRAELAERGGGSCSRTSPPSSPPGRALAGEPAAAAELGAEGCRLLEQLGEQSFLSTAAGQPRPGALRARPARRGRRLGRPRCGLGASDDAMTQMLWRQVRAKVLARRGELAEAERLAREAVAIGEEPTSSTGKATRTPTSPRCSARRQARRGGGRARARPGAATSARATSSWPGGRATGWSRSPRARAPGRSVRRSRRLCRRTRPASPRDDIQLRDRPTSSCRGGPT